MILKGTREREQERHKEKEVKESVLRGFHGAVAEVGDRKGEDKSTAALSPYEGERPAVCTQRLSRNYD